MEAFPVKKAVQVKTLYHHKKEKQEPSDAKERLNGHGSQLMLKAIAIPTHSPHRQMVTAVGTGTVPLN